MSDSSAINKEVAPAAKPKKQRNYAVDFWRTFATLFVTFFHFWLFHPMGYAKGTGELTVTWLITGNILPVFLITTGYFLAKGYESKVRRGLTEGVSCVKQAWYYMLGRYKGLYPAYFLGILWGFIVMNFIFVQLPASQVLSNFVNSIYEFLGLSSIGVNATASTGFDYYPIVMYAWNGPLWYISAIFVGGFLIYYLLCKNKDLFCGVIAPLVIIISFGWWGLYGEGTTAFGAIGGYSETISYSTKCVLALGLIENSLLYGISGMCLGVLVYYIVEWLKGFHYSEFTKKVLTVINGGFTILILWWMIAGNAFDETVLMVFITVCLMLVLLGQDYFTQLINRKIFGTLGEFSLYFFVAHFPMIYVFQSLFTMTNENYYLMLGLSVVCNALLGLVFRFIAKKWISPFLNGAFVKRDKQEA